MAALHVSPRTLRDLGWPQIIGAVAARTRTARGHSLAEALPFLERREEIETSFARIAEARELGAKELSLPLGGGEDIRELVGLAAKGMLLEPAQLMACARTIRTASSVRSFLHEHRLEAPLLAELSYPLPEATSLASRIETSFEASGRMRDDASGVLGSLRDRSRGLHRAIKGRLEELMAEQDFATTLRDDYLSIRNDRYVVPVNASFRSRVPGIIHNASNSGQTLFIEPQEIVGLGNDLSIAESMAAEEERRILLELSGDLGARSVELIEAVEILGLLDRIQASAALAEELDAVAPALSDASAAPLLRQARHPLLALQGKEVVPNDIHLDPEQRALVVSGPNAGGKTVTITTVGLCALLCRAGLPIPAAQGTVMPLFRQIVSVIGDEQDLSQDLSTFSAHLTSLRDIVGAARSGALALIDEIAAGTDPREGAALAGAVLQELVDRGALVFVTTHLEELKALGFSDARFANARVGLDPQSLAPTFHLELGEAGASSALEIAGRVGLPAAVLEEARLRLHGGSALAAALEKLESERRELGLERGALERERLRLESALVEAREAKIEAERALREAEASIREELREELEAVRREAGEILAKLKAAPKIPAAVEAQRHFQERADQQVRAQERARAHAESARERGPSPPSQAIRPGSRVKVLTLGSQAEVLELGRADALVAVGSLKTRVKLDDLIPLGAPKRAAPAWRQKETKRGRAQQGEAADPDAPPEARCDVRGLRADEAEREIELFLDRAYSEGMAAVSILHGHGTGALKKLVRESLSELPHVALVRPAARHEGGDAVTVVTFKG